MDPIWVGIARSTIIKYSGVGTNLVVCLCVCVGGGGGGGSMVELFKPRLLTS